MSTSNRSTFVLKTSSHNYLAESFTLHHWGISREYQIDVELVNPSHRPDITEPVCFQMGENRYHGYVSTVHEAFSAHIHKLHLSIVSPLSFFLKHIHTRVYNCESRKEVLYTLLTEAGLKEGVHFEMDLPNTDDAVWMVQDKERSIDFLNYLLAGGGFFYYYEQTKSHAICKFSNNIHSFLSKEAIALPLHAITGLNSTQGMLSCSQGTRLNTKFLKNRLYQWAAADVSETPYESMHSQALGTVITNDPTNQHTHARQALEDEKAQEWKITLQSLHVQPGQQVILSSPVLGTEKAWVKSIQVEGALSPSADALSPEQHGTDTTKASYMMVYVTLASHLSGVPEKSGRNGSFHHTFHTADIESRNGTYADVTEEGEYYVRLHLDEPVNGNPSDHHAKPKTSPPVRNALYYAGNGYGFGFPLHDCTEVLVAYENGHATKPILLGVLPNKTNPSVVSQINNHANLLRSPQGSEMSILARQNECVVQINTAYEENKLALFQDLQNFGFSLATLHGSLTIDSQQSLHSSAHKGYFNAGSQRIWTNDKLVCEAKNGELLFVSRSISTITCQKKLNFESGELSLYAEKKLHFNPIKKMSIKTRNVRMNTKGLQSWRAADGVLYLKVRNKLKIQGAGAMLALSPTHINLQASGVIRLNALAISGL